MELTRFIEAVLNKHPDTSDIHFKSGVVNRIRMHGDMHSVENFSSTNASIESFVKGVNQKASDFETAETLLDWIEKESDGEKSGHDFAFKLNEWRFRGNLSYSNSRKLLLVLRKIDSEIPEIKNLGLPKNFTKQLSFNNGLCLITGATGSGKSTTLASSLQYIANEYPKNILTIEDPVEYIIKESKSTVHQKEVGTDVATFKGALRSALRQDPDILMIGEIRDLTTMKAAVSMAETGHLVFATLHTNGAASTVERCLSFYEAGEKDLARNSIAGVLNFVLSQSLAKRADGKGRVMAYDLMVNNHSIKQSILDNKVNHINNTMESGSRDGHFLMHKVLADYVKQGLVTKEDALAATNDIRKLKDLLS